MWWRMELVQIMAVNLALIIGSFFPIPYLGIVLATVRDLLVIVFGVSLFYLLLQLRSQRWQPVRIERNADLLYERERGR